MESLIKDLLQKVEALTSRVEKLESENKALKKAVFTKEGRSTAERIAYSLASADLIEARKDDEKAYAEKLKAEGKFEAEFISEMLDSTLSRYESKREEHIADAIGGFAVFGLSARDFKL